MATERAKGSVVLALDRRPRFVRPPAVRRYEVPPRGRRTPGEPARCTSGWLEAASVQISWTHADARSGTCEQHGADVQNAKKSAKSSHRFAISEACVGVGAVTAIVIVIRETCDVETGVRRDRAIDGRLGVQGSARVEVECAGRPPGDGPVEVWPLARSRPEPLLRTWRSGSARRGVDWRDYELPDSTA